MLSLLPLLLAETVTAPWWVAAIAIPAAGAVWGAVRAVAKTIAEANEARIAAIQASNAERIALEKARADTEVAYRNQLVALFEERERKLREDLVIITRFIDVLTNLKNSIAASEEDDEPDPPAAPKRRTTR